MAAFSGLPVPSNSMTTTMFAALLSDWSVVKTGFLGISSSPWEASGLPDIQC